jgi:pimeloyl-ACP methyl ester carboxylesterase
MNDPATESDRLAPESKEIWHGSCAVAAALFKLELLRRNVMSKNISVFRSPEDEAQHKTVYEAALRMWPVPYEELYIPTRFGDTHVIASGPKEAAPLVLFHPSGCGAAIWYRNVGPFSQHFRTYAVDTMGEVNKSILAQPVRSRQEFADWIVDLFSGLQIENADLVGNSFGGFLTLNTALYLPSRVKKMVLISPAATFVQMWAWTWHFFPAYMIGSKHLLLKAYDWIWQGFPSDECIQQLRAITRVSGVPHHVPPSVFSDEELRKIQTPTLMLIGDHEVIYKPELAIRRATRLMSGLRAEIVPNANHNAEYTAPDLVNAKILDFLAG